MRVVQLDQWSDFHKPLVNFPRRFVRVLFFNLWNIATEYVLLTVLFISLKLTKRISSQSQNIKVITTFINQKILNNLIDGDNGFQNGVQASSINGI